MKGVEWEKQKGSEERQLVRQKPPLIFRLFSGVLACLKILALSATCLATVGCYSVIYGCVRLANIYSVTSVCLNIFLLNCRKPLELGRIIIKYYCPWIFAHGAFYAAASFFDPSALLFPSVPGKSARIFLAYLRPKICPFRHRALPGPSSLLAQPSLHRAERKTRRERRGRVPEKVEDENKRGIIFR